MSEQTAEHSLAAEVTTELSRCRQRGLDELDLRAHNKEPVEVPALQRLARGYCAAKGFQVYGRVAEIRTLLHDALAAYAERGHQPESQFMTRLFFDLSDSVPKKRPSVLLEEAQKASGLDKESFAEYRRDVFAHFAEFLMVFVAQANREDVAQQPEPARAGVMSAQRITWRQSSLLRVAATIISLLVICALIGVLVWSATHTQSTRSPAATATVTSDPSGRLYTEIAGEFGSPTFTDPHSPSVTGPRIEPYEHVQVSCKVLAPTIPSISPDGYWYRLVSPQRVRGLYTPAVNFLNGDPVHGVRKHNTDFAVPDCPG